MISGIDIVTSSGAKVYRVGDNVNGKIIDRIDVGEIRFQGDPYDHYVGYGKDFEKIFSINCLTPCVVEYE